MSKKILIIDDSAVFRKVVSMNLKHAGYEVVEAVDGMDALSKLPTVKPNLIDLEKVNDFDTAAIQLFISAKNTAKKFNKKIKIISHPNCVIAILDLYGLISFFGDKIILTPEERKKYSFKYGTQKKKVHST